MMFNITIIIRAAQAVELDLTVEKSGIPIFVSQNTSNVWIGFLHNRHSINPPSFSCDMEPSVELSFVT